VARGLPAAADDHPPDPHRPHDPARHAARGGRLPAEILDEVYLDDAIPGEIFPGGVPAERVERGRRLYFQRYGCQACHQAEGAGGYYGPPLDDTARKLESGWIAWWLGGPQRWRPDVRCPDYGIEAEEATDLAAFLLSLGAPAAETEGGAS
jgi:mono/diheme cytochrome c family protein